MKLIKYNYSLDKEVQNHICYDSYMQISEDESALIITNKKPVEDVYVLQAEHENCKHDEHCHVDEAVFHLAT